MIPFTENSRKCQLIYSDREQTSGCREQGGTEEGGGGRPGRVANRIRECLGVMGVLPLLIMASWMSTSVKTYQVVHFKYMQFPMCRLYLNKAVF